MAPKVRRAGVFRDLCSPLKRPAAAAKAKRKRPAKNKEETVCRAMVPIEPEAATGAHGTPPTHEAPEDSDDQHRDELQPCGMFSIDDIDGAPLQPSAAAASGASQHGTPIDDERDLQTHSSPYQREKVRISSHGKRVWAPAEKATEAQAVLNRLRAQQPGWTSAEWSETVVNVMRDRFDCCAHGGIRGDPWSNRSNASFARVTRVLRRGCNGAMLPNRHSS